MLAVKTKKRKAAITETGRISRIKWRSLRCWRILQAESDVGSNGVSDSKSSTTSQEALGPYNPYMYRTSSVGTTPRAQSRRFSIQTIFPSTSEQLNMLEPQT